MSDRDRSAGKGSLVAQNHGTESLLGVSKNVVDIRKFYFRPGKDGKALFKQLQQYPETIESEIPEGKISPAIMFRLFGKKAASVRKLLIRRGYCRPVEEKTCVLTSKFRNIAVEDFDIGLGPRACEDIYRSLEVLLWNPLSDEPGMNLFQKSVSTGSDDTFKAAHRIGEKEYWFRQGNVVNAFRFAQTPSSELLDLIDLKLGFIEQEKMRNYFHILSSFNADSATWMDEKDRGRRFFEIVGHLLNYSWRPFDMEFCELSIDARGDEGLFASGTLRVDFSETGATTSSFDRMEKRFPPAASGANEFSVNDVSLRAADATGESSILCLRLVSRTNGNVDPRRNNLTHRFVKLLVETVGKLIDVIMPVIRREDALNNLRWQSFLDSHRLQALEHGEDLHRIVTVSLRVLNHFFGISEVKIYVEDREINHMLDLFGRNDPTDKLYMLLESPLSPADILKKQMVVFPIREIPNGRILLYFELPRAGNRPLNPEIPDQYLMGTDLWKGVNEEALLLGLPELKDYLFFMATECLTANPKAVIDNLNRRLPVRGGVKDIEGLMKLSRRILERYSRFFDLFGALSGNLESGLAYMRGRRDNLTGLYNRQYFTALLNEAFTRPGYNFGLMFVDMDNFKIFNDAVSHDFGDKLLVSLANRLIDSADSVGGDAIPGRFGGDEFCFSMASAQKEDFEEQSIKVFKAITERPLVVSFFFDDRSVGDGMEINLIAFLHRLMRPDVGSRQASRTEYVEKANMGPRSHVIDVWKHYQIMEGEEVGGRKVKAENLIDDISSNIEDKILYNKIFPEIDAEFAKIIRLFITLQMKDYTTNRIRESLINSIGSLSVEREITLKVSAGLAHSSENRLRSMDSLFKAADSRSYLAKHNGRNCMFGVDGQRLT